MPDARKGRDLRWDPRFALNFRADIDEVVITRVGEPVDHLVIELWPPDRPLHRIQRH
jgi:hypothetical protein